MDSQQMTKLIDHYVEVYFFGSKRIAAMISDRIVDLVTPDQFVVLGYIQKNGPCLTSQVSDYCCVNRGATTAMIDRLVNKGYVQRSTDEKDRRIVLVSMTPKGEEVVNAGYKSAYQLIESVIKQFNPEDVEKFILMFEQVAELFKKGNEEE